MVSPELWKYSLCLQYDDSQGDLTKHPPHTMEKRSETNAANKMPCFAECSSLNYALACAGKRLCSHTI